MTRDEAQRNIRTFYEAVMICFPSFRFVFYNMTMEDVNGFSL